ncbi:MAG: dihydrofolate reductase [Alistipes sp.]|nr:dihydrofolate reductase [Alistipes sp.]
MKTIIAAVAQNGVIGDDNALLWHISEDMRRFRALTSGHTVIMGRKTYESIGRPLPNRRNIVLTRGGFSVAGCESYASLESALSSLSSEEEVFIIGGAQVYALTMDIADCLELTIIERDYEGDVSFPLADLSEWRLVSSERHERGETFEYPFRFERYERKKN